MVHYFQFLAAPFLLASFSLVVIGSVPLVPRLIIDTDIGAGGCMDVDDVAAICMAHALADAGEVDILAIVQNTAPVQGSGVISALNYYYGRPNLPIGAYKGNDLDPDGPVLPYVADIVSNFPSRVKNSTQVPSAIQVYREVLASQADSSVTISSIGLLTNLRDLLKSQPDACSSLDGKELVAKKVKRIAIMGGKYPASGAAPECNLCGCYNGASSSDAATASAASAYVVANIPENVQVVFSGFEIGIKVQSGGVLSTCAPLSNPCRRAFRDYEHGDGSRFSWDPLNTLAAVRGFAGEASCNECVNCSGRNTVDALKGTNAWSHGRATNQSYLVLNDAVAAGKSIDELLCRPPRNGTSPNDA